MRLIDADVLNDRLQSLAYDDWNQGASTTWAEAYGEVADMVYDQPTVDAAPVTRAKWIKTELGNYACPKCGGEPWYCRKIEYKFCPYCGVGLDL